MTYMKKPSDNRFKVGMKVSYKGKAGVIKRIEKYQRSGVVCPNIIIELSNKTIYLLTRENLDQLKITECAGIVHSF